MSQIQTKMDYHLSLLNKSLETTEKMIALTNNGQIDQVSSMADNRERLLAIVSDVQMQIEKELEQNIAKENKHYVQKANSWISRTQICIQQISDLDEELLDKLNQEKENTKKEIGKVHGNKTSIQGYNLSNVKR